MNKELLQQAPMIRHYEERLEGSGVKLTLPLAVKTMADVASPPSDFTVTTRSRLASQDAQLRQLLDPRLLKAEPVATCVAPVAEPVTDALAIGLDIESADNLPSPADAWSEPFYVENFTGAEIAWCLRQPDPRLSFCGLWSAKEAALKCGREFAGLRPVEIEILHDQHGRPMLRPLRPSPAARTTDWVLSISQAGRMGMAVCVKKHRASRRATVSADAVVAKDEILRDTYADASQCEPQAA